MKKKIVAGIMILIMLMILPACTIVINTPDDPAPQTGTEEILSEDEIKTIILEQADGSVESDIVLLERDYDDGEYRYEGKIYNKGHLYEFEVSGETGNILEWEIDD